LEITSSSTFTPIISPDEDDLYLESDDVNPNQVFYDLDNNRVIIPENEEDDIIEEQSLNFVSKKTFSRNVRNSRRRNS
jgi:hypothetical protein